MAFRLPLALGSVAYLLLIVTDVLPAQSPYQFSGIPSYLVGQRAKKSNKRPSEPPKSNLKASGTIQRIVSAGVLHVVTGEGKNWLIALDPKAKPEDMKYLGSADPSWLKPGRFVQFIGRFNKRGESKSQVGELKVFSPHAKSRLGVFPLGDDYEGVGEEEANQPDDLQLGADPVSGEGFFEELLEEARRDNRPQSPVSYYRISGQLTSAKDGRIVVNTGRNIVKAPLAEDAAIEVEISDVRYARPGDKFELQGYYYPVQRQRGYASKLTITAAKPLTGPAAFRKSKSQDRSADEQ
jgi:hypothetical protein